MNKGGATRVTHEKVSKSNVITKVILMNIAVFLAEQLKA
jgi:hypothetical protein